MSEDISREVNVKGESVDGVLSTTTAPMSISVSLGTQRDYGQVSAKVEVTDFKQPGESTGELFARVNKNATVGLTRALNDLLDALGLD